VVALDLAPVGRRCGGGGPRASVSPPFNGCRKRFPSPFHHRVGTHPA
jgi:hypothetical protein